jgi:colanic acid/amylovoran biosynthesis protein
MNVLIINQHTSNRGDESAGKALLSRLKDEEWVKEIGIIYNEKGLSDSEKLNTTTAKTIRHYEKHFTIIDKVLIILSLLLPFRLIRTASRVIGDSGFGREMALVEKADLVLNAPSGVNLGPYKDWIYLWRIYAAIKSKKHTAIYSISFGPLPGNFLFRKKSWFVLKNVDFLSLRDKRSQDFAAANAVNYIPAIDTAFLETNHVSGLPDELNETLNGSYCVFVPNRLYAWHPCFMNISPRQLDSFYVDVMNLFLSKGNKLVMLPQLYGKYNDSEYFGELKLGTLKPDMVTIISDKYNSDTQQLIIRKAAFVIGARYHSIVFAVNNKIPFISLSYEHKMEYMLDILRMKDRNIDLTELFASGRPIEHCLDDIARLYENPVPEPKLAEANRRAKQIAEKTYEHFRNDLAAAITIDESRPGGFGALRNLERSEDSG